MKFLVLRKKTERSKNHKETSLKNIWVRLGARLFAAFMSWIKPAPRLSKPLLTSTTPTPQQCVDSCQKYCTQYIRTPFCDEHCSQNCTKDPTYVWDSRNY